MRLECFICKIGINRFNWLGFFSCTTEKNCLRFGFFINFLQLASNSVEKAWKSTAVVSATWILTAAGDSRINKQNMWQVSRMKHWKWEKYQSYYSNGRAALPSFLIFCGVGSGLFSRDSTAATQMPRQKLRLNLESYKFATTSSTYPYDSRCPFIV